MADVFISYHRSEGTSALVRRIAAELEPMGITCWYDTKDPNPGYFVQTIEQEILRCKVFLLIWDEGANNSEWCITETYTAFNGANHSVRIPFQIGAFPENNEMRFYMRRLQSFYGGDFPENANIKKLVAKIAALLGKTPAKVEQPPVKAEKTPPKVEQPPVKIIKSGSCGENVIYALNENGVLTISGTGNMQNYQGVDIYPPWWPQHAAISFVHIERGVTSIGYGAFFDCQALRDIIIPDSVTSIGELAFHHCVNLAHASIPDSVTDIAANAFGACISLTSVSIPKNANIRNAFPAWTEVIRRS